MEPDTEINDQVQIEDLQDLEKAFQEEAGFVATAEPIKMAPAPSQNGFSHTLSTLTETDRKLEIKINEFKMSAKKELEDLKTLKNGIAKKIADIKELEETREKIKKELEKIQHLESEVGALTDEAKHELGEI